MEIWIAKAYMNVFTSFGFTIIMGVSISLSIQTVKSQECKLKFYQAS